LLTTPKSPVLIFTPIVSELPVTRPSPRASCRAGDMLVHGPGNKVSRPFYFLQFGSGIGGAGEDGRNLPQRCRYFYGSGPAELPGPQAV